MSSKRRETALAFLSAFENLDFEGNLLLRTPDCTHIFRPSSQPPPINNSQFAAHIQKLKAVISRFPVWPKEVMEDEQQNQVIVWAEGDAFFKDELKDEGDWSYRGEYVFIFTMDQSGEKIERVVEFLDNKAADRARELVRRATANLEKMNK